MRAVLFSLVVCCVLVALVAVHMAMNSPEGRPCQMGSTAPQLSSVEERRATDDWCFGSELRRITNKEIIHG